METGTGIIGQSVRWYTHTNTRNGIIIRIRFCKTLHCTGNCEMCLFWSICAKLISSVPSLFGICAICAICAHLSCSWYNLSMLVIHQFPRKVIWYWLLLDLTCWLKAIFAHTFPFLCTRGGVSSHIGVEHELCVSHVAGLVIAIGWHVQTISYNYSCCGIVSIDTA